MSSVVVANPRFDEHVEQEESKSFFQRNSSVLKGLMLIGVVGAVGAVGFVLGGQFSEDSNSSSSTTTEVGASNEPLVEPATLEMAKGTVEKAVLTGGDQVWDFLKIDAFDGLLDRYEVTGQNEWSDSIFTANIMEGLRFMRNSHRSNEAEIRSLMKSSLRPRKLDSALTQAAWDAIEGETYDGPNSITYENDRAVVKKQSGYCFIVAEETNAANDWGANFNLGQRDILAVGGTSKVGRGYKGFVNAYNAMRNDIWSLYNSVCSSSDTVVLAGYSRGAGILQALALAILKQDLHSASRLKSVTFGAPRTLIDNDADYVHGKFEQIRVVYRKDPVPSIPYPFMGFKHFGALRCMSCSYSSEFPGESGRDRPSWAWIVDGGIRDHTSYDTLTF